MTEKEKQDFDTRYKDAMADLRMISSSGIDEVGNQEILKTTKVAIYKT